MVWVFGRVKLHITGSEGVKEFELKIRLSQSNLAEAGTELGNKRNLNCFPNIRTSFPIVFKPSIVH